MDITKISPRPPGLAGALRARKSVEAIVARNDQEPGHGLKRSMGLVHLTALSIGASLGTGIFVILGEATPKAGPAVVLASCSRRSPPSSPLSPTRNWQAASPSPVAPTRTPTRRWANSSRGSAAGA